MFICSVEYLTEEPDSDCEILMKNVMKGIRHSEAGIHVRPDPRIRMFITLSQSELSFHVWGTAFLLVPKYCCCFC